MKQGSYLLMAFMLFFSWSYGQKKMKSLNDLLDEQSTGIDFVTQWKARAKNKVEIIPSNNSQADSVLFNSQLSTSTPIGSMIYSCGGILVDNGWLRVLGSGSNQLRRNLPEWNKGKSFYNYGDDPNFILVADDAIGGLFAVNKGGIDPENIDKVFYFGPNSLQWQSIGLSYREFLSFCLSGDVAGFYDGFRWKGWQEDVKKLSTDQVVSCYPLLWTRDGKELKCNRKVMSVQQVWDLYPIQNKLVASKKSSKNQSLKGTKKILAVNDEHGSKK